MDKVNRSSLALGLTAVVAAFTASYLLSNRSSEAAEGSDGSASKGKPEAEPTATSKGPGTPTVRVRLARAESAGAVAPAKPKRRGLARQSSVM